MTTNKPGSVKPFIKWVGGKRQLLPELQRRLPEHITELKEEPQSLQASASPDCSELTQYQTRCRDCGRFVPRDRWVLVGAPSGARPLCWSCLSVYDDPAFL